MHLEEADDHHVGAACALLEEVGHPLEVLCGLQVVEAWQLPVMVADDHLFQAVVS